MTFYGFNDYLKNNNLKFFYDSLPLEAQKISFSNLYEELNENIYGPDTNTSLDFIADKKMIQKMYLGYCKENNLASDLFYKDITAAAFNELNFKELIFRFMDFLKEENLIVNDCSIDIQEYATMYRDRYIEYCLMNGYLREYL